MKKFLFGLLLTCAFTAKGQVYNNEWIEDYSKTYYKFKVGKTGIYRITQSVLSSAGLSSIPAEHFQLWRNGKQVPIYTTVASGVFGGADYIEFWGEMNDGRPDKELYRKPEWQLNDKWSLETDTAAFFLTVNTNINNNFRLQTTINNVAGNTLPAETYFMHTVGQYFRAKINLGYAVNVGDYLYSSSYDRGEGWSSADITTTFSSGNPNYGKNTFVFNNLYVFNGGPSSKFKIAVSGNAINQRRYLSRLNSDSLFGKTVDFFNYSVDSVNFPTSYFNSSADTISVQNLTQCSATACPNFDRLVVHKYELTYPRQFNFAGASNFEFTLPASATGNFLQISNFNYGSAAPVLYDLTNGKRYVGDITAAPLIKFALEPSASQRSLVLVSEEASNITAINNLQARNFIHYTAPANQGDYIIISHPALFNGANGTDPVEEYRLYRSSSAGGAYIAKTYLIDEIIDQFGFGIKKNPAAIRNFLRYARLNYTISPKHVFLIGHGVNYINQRNSEAHPDIDKLNFIPPYGYPASDVLLTAEPGSSLPELSIGRLSVINGQEVATYLKKVKEFEQQQVLSSLSIADKAWMKNVVHIVGASEPGLEGLLSNYLDVYGKIISDTLFGGKVNKFSKSGTSTIEQLNSNKLFNLFRDGISLITYFGHSSSTTLEYNLDNPENYNNFGKYPVFLGLGCNAGNFFGFSTVRLQAKETLSERYVLAPDRGTIAFVASTHFGIVHYLDIWSSRAYKEMAYRSYGKTLGEIMKATAKEVFNYTTQEDFYARCNTEESELHGDPAIRLNPHAKPDYVVEDPMVKVVPGFVSVADESFKVNASFLNIGKATNKNIVVEVKRQLPDLSITLLRRDTIPGIRYEDTISVEVDINPVTDKGLNKIIVTVDVDNDVDELFETNNSITKDVMIYEDEARPVYPYNYAIINKQGIKFKASTANPFSLNKQYQFEIDTTELFNSSLKVVKTITTPGGLMEFDPAITFMDSTVYYWRVSPVVTVTGSPTWNTASFIYMNLPDVGFNQSHLFQHFKSEGTGIKLDSASRKWKYEQVYRNIFVRQGTWATSTGQEAGLSVAINAAASMRNTCAFQSVVFNVFDPLTFQPWKNVTPPGTPANYYSGGMYGSATNICNSGRQNNFEYRWDSASSRKDAMDFMDTIPDGAYVVVRSFLLDPGTYPGFVHLIKYASDWEADTLANGTGKSLYHYLKNAGFADVDSFNRPRNFAFVYRKNDPSFTPKWVFTHGVYDNVTLSADCGVPDTVGFITSPKFGPAKQWKEMRWNGGTVDVTPGDNPRMNIIGIKWNGDSDTLIKSISPAQNVVNLSSINAVQYPFVQLQMVNADTVNVTPYHLNFWRLTYLPAPEGAIAPNIYFSMKDTVDVAEPLSFKVAFANVSEAAFTDSVRVRLVVTDRNNYTHVIPDIKLRPLPVNDTLNIRFPADTRDFVGANNMYIEVNPDNDQPEQYHFNNFFYKDFYVRGDTLNPLLDVTFDNVHIINHDIVSSRPNIVVKLRDEAKWFLVDDPTTLKVQVREVATGNIHDYSFGTDTLQFFPAQQAPSLNNTATAVFKPYFEQDGTYELIVKGKDMSENSAGRMEYRVFFEVINKAMISNMLNYPNPFTTSTAFVFTLTGSEVPQNIRIQVLTVTGKIVREITKEELGPLHIGRNITEFKWDGTDQYGQKLANGVYLYRVITNQHGKSLEKYKASGDNTDKYFNKGYGKMYLMR